jgi:hypothetical protein
VINNQYENALSLFAEVSSSLQSNVSCCTAISFLLPILIHCVQLLKPEVFEFIEKYNLHDAIHDKV